MKLYSYQSEAVEKLKSGSILCGGVGSGKSITALSYFLNKEKVTHPNLFIITTARKRDTLEWERDCAHFALSKGVPVKGTNLIIDSWNRIDKYTEVEDSFFIFDEQRVVGNGTWVKSFLKIAKKNHWILLSATPGDTWLDYIPVFIANGFVKNRTHFMNKYVVLSRFCKFPKVDYYIHEDELEGFRDDILVDMDYASRKERHVELVECGYNEELYSDAMTRHWNVFKNEPVKDAGAMCYILREITNGIDKLMRIDEVLNNHDKVIVFYNFDSELETLMKITHIPVAQWNGHRHDPIPDSDRWLYLVQYTAGAEGWNCVETNAIIFYSLNYSYKIMFQAAGRIDRVNSSFKDLYYYILLTDSSIDEAILKTLKTKRKFNAEAFLDSQKKHTF